MPQLSGLPSNPSRDFFCSHIIDLKIHMTRRRPVNLLLKIVKATCSGLINEPRVANAKRSHYQCQYVALTATFMLRINYSLALKSDLLIPNTMADKQLLTSSTRARRMLLPKRNTHSMSCGRGRGKVQLRAQFSE